jgi:hypothetical protein
MYVRVYPEDILIDTKYKIIVNCDCSYIEAFSMIVRVHSDLYLMISNEKVFTSLNCEFYRYVRENPQWKMERRSVNMIVRRLIGDDHFEW